MARRREGKCDNSVHGPFTGFNLIHPLKSYQLRIQIRCVNQLAHRPCQRAIHLSVALFRCIREFALFAPLRQHQFAQIARTFELGCSGYYIGGGGLELGDSMDQYLKRCDVPSSVSQDTVGYQPVGAVVGDHSVDHVLLGGRCHHLPEHIA